MKKILFLTAVILAMALLCACGTTAPIQNRNYTAETTPDDDIQGKVTENTYENPAIGVGFSVPDGWTFYSDNEIASSLSTPVKFSDDPTMQTSEIANYFCDTAAFSEDLKSAIIVTVEEKRESTIGLLQETLIDNTISLAKKDGNQIYDKYEIEKKQFAIGEDDVWGYDAVSTHEDVKLYQRCILTDNDKYITTIMLTSPEEAVLNELVEKFFKVV